MTPRTDSELLADDDTSAFVEFVRRHQLPIAQYVTRRLDPAHVDDIVNEAFAIAYTRRATYDGRGPDARAWLLGIATNLIRRHSETEAKNLRAYAAGAAEPHLDELVDTFPIDRALAGALASLRSQYRDALFLHAVADLSHDEIAAAMGVPVGTARSWVTRARKLAVKHLEANGFSRTELEVRQ